MAHGQTEAGKMREAERHRERQADKLTVRQIQKRQKTEREAMKTCNV